MVMYVVLWLRNLMLLTIIFGIWRYVCFRQKGIKDAVIAALYISMPLSGLISYIHVTRHIKAIAASPYVVAEDAFTIRHTRELKLTLPYHESFDLCVMSLDSVVKHYRLMVREPTIGKVVAQSYRSWWDNLFGTRIEFNIHELRDGSYVRITTQPFFPLSIVDKGKSLTYIEKLTQFLRTYR